MLRYHRLAGLAVTCLLVACIAVSAQPPRKDGPGGGPGKGAPKVEGKGRFGGFGQGGFGTRTKPGTILASSVQETLKLTDEQKKQVEELQKDVDARLAKILTDDQKKQLKEMQDARTGRFGGDTGRGKGRGGFPPKKDN